MSMTVVGVFDAYGDAERAQERLITECGLDRSAVRVTGGSVETHHERPGGIRRFFAELFGTDDEDAQSGEYSEAVRRGSAVVTADLTDDSRVDDVRDALEACGAIDIDERVQQWRAAGWSGYDADAPSTGTSQAGAQRSAGADEVLPVVQEELQVGKREVERGRVRVHRRVVERPVEEQLSLREERAVVERQAVDRPASAADLDAALQDRDIEVRETAEEPVVSKRARVVEEVRVGKEATERTETVRDTVRRTEVDVEDESDVPGSGRMGTLSGNYSGPERRISTATYGGVDRRAPH